jgi:hypothetical protein
VLQQESLLDSPRIEIIRKYTFPLWFHVRELLRKGKEQGAFRFGSLNNALLNVMGALMFHKKTGYFMPLMDPGEFTDTETLIAELTVF